jgi:hypothetical protein
MIKPCLHDALLVARHGKGGHCDHLDVFRIRVTPDDFSGSDAIHEGHLEVHEDQIRLVLLRHFDARLTIFRL